MTTTSASSGVYRVTRLLLILVLMGLLAAAVLSVQFIASPADNKDNAAFWVMTAWLVVFGAAAIVAGAVGMRRTAAHPAERVRYWYAIAFGLVALSIGATFGVGFV